MATITDVDVEGSPVAPPDAGLAAGAMQSRIAATLFGDAALPTLVGRFEVRSILGAGGMGVVYAATDPRLDRTVALKVLPGESVGDERQRGRLVREARALAKLSHPNVVAIHEVGEHDGGVFVVMEHVDGLPLQKWQADATRSLAQILDVFLQAAEGLVAAHAAGVVHRDFKPSNVLVGTDGRVRVADFGLARVVSGSSQLPSAETTSGGALEDTSSVIAGTPAYMSPEQATGRSTDARSDQFSFCVALWESVFGVRPWEPAQIRGLGLGAPRPPPAQRRGGPRWLRRVLARGLAADPGHRWTSMELLRDVLRSRHRRGRRIALGLGTACVVAVTVAVSRNAQEPCPDPSAALVGIWDDTRQTALEERVRAGAPAFAAEALPAIRGRLDSYATSWLDARLDACEATFVRSDQSEEQFDRSVACLARARHALGSAVDALVDATPEAIAAADAVVDRLPDVGACRDIRVLRDGPDPPAADVEAEVQDVQHHVDRAGVLLVAGRTDEARALAVEAHDRAQVLGHEATLAEAMFVLGQVHASEGKIEVARRALFSAGAIAMGARAHEVAVRAWHRLVAVAKSDLERPGDAREWLDLAGSSLRLHGQSPLLEAEHIDHEGLVATAEADHARAHELHRRAADALAELLPEDDLRVIQVQHRAANALLRLRKLDEAERMYLSIEERVHARFGARHPEYARISHNLALLALLRGDDEEARRRFRISLEILTDAFGPKSLRLAAPLTSLAQIAKRAGDLDTAEELAARGWELQRAALPAGHSERGSALALLAQVNLKRRAHESALAQHRELALEFANGAHTDRLPEVYQNIGWLLCALDRCTEAREPYQKGRELVAPDAPAALYLEVLAARIELAEGDASAAVNRLDGLLPRAEPLPAKHHPELVPEARWVLAQALVARNHEGDCKRALSNIATARAGYLATETRPDAVPELDRLAASLPCGRAR